MWFTKHSIALKSDGPSSGVKTIVQLLNVNPFRVIRGVSKAAS
jgi:hypothetical protein